MTNYDLYSAVNLIAQAVVKQSKGFGLNKLDGNQIREDLEEAERIANIAECYWDTLKNVNSIKDKVKAAKTLDLDSSQFEDDLAAAEAVLNMWVEKMEKVIYSGKYHKDMYGSWKVKN